MRIRLPGYIELLRAPEGTGSGGGTEPAGGGSGAASTAPAPAADTSGAPSSPSGASPAPTTPTTPTPATAKPEAPEQPEPLGEDPFSGFGADEGDEPLVPKEPVAKEQQADTQVQSPPAKAPEPAATAPQQTATPQQTQAGPQEVVPQLPSPAEPARMGSVLLENIEAFSEHLAQQPEFKLSEADIEAINSDVVTAIPKLMARTFVRAQASALSQMDRVIPAMVERFMKLSKAREASEGKFYARWPSINKAEHQAVVDRLAQTYRKENPQAPLQQMVEELGPLVMMVAKIAPTTQQPNGTGGPPAAASVRKPPATPFQPAVGGSASPPAQAEPQNAWLGYGAQEDE